MFVVDAVTTRAPASFVRTRTLVSWITWPSVGDTIVSVPVLLGLASTEGEPAIDAPLEHAVARSAITALVTQHAILRPFRIAIGKHTQEHTPRR
jgi:hypothetical protein